MEDSKNVIEVKGGDLIALREQIKEEHGIVEEDMEIKIKERLEEERRIHDLKVARRKRLEVESVIREISRSLYRDWFYEKGHEINGKAMDMWIITNKYVDGKYKVYEDLDVDIKLMFDNFFEYYKENADQMSIGNEFKDELEEFTKRFNK